jgi:hypothetical protein
LSFCVIAAIAGSHANIAAQQHHRRRHHRPSRALSISLSLSLSRARARVLAFVARSRALLLGLQQEQTNCVQFHPNFIRYSLEHFIRS